MKKELLLVAFAFGSVMGFSQTMIPLYKGAIPNSKPCNKIENNPAEGRVAGITIPALYVFIPVIKDSVKTAIIVCPGGGYTRLSIDPEGFKVAQELNKKGITAFVLKYRNPIDSDCVLNKEIVALQDAQQALKLVRDGAEGFDISPTHLGMMGFSAGGHLTSTAATHFNMTVIENKTNSNLRPDFIILGYPVISFADNLAHKGSKENMLGKNATEEKIELYSNELQVTAQTPPTFIIHAADDKTVKVQNSLLFFAALQKKGVPAEMHILQAGGHGFGLNNKAEPFNWLNNIFVWMKLNKFMK